MPIEKRDKYAVEENVNPSELDVDSVVEDGCVSPLFKHKEEDSLFYSEFDPYGFDQ